MTGAPARELRAVGLALEVYRLRDFDLEVQGEDYVVRGWAAPETPGESDQTEKAGARAPGRLWRLFRGHPAQPDKPPVQPEPPAPVELRFAPADVARLEHEGESSRREPGAMPDLYNTSQILRTVGYFLESRYARLLRLSKKGPRLTIAFEGAPGQTQVEERTVAYLYDLFTRMYLSRER